jgi:purine-binding chemotaxis protein CheW
MSTQRAILNEKINESDEVLSQYLTFVLANGEYGVEILCVQEIRGWGPVTRIPNTPDYVQGILNLRGTIVPIVDLRMRFGLEKIEYGPTTVIVVLKTMYGNAKRVVGIVVDGVSDVHSLRADEIKPAPDFGESLKTEFIKGMATIGEKMLVLLDVDRLLNYRELETVEAAFKNE